MVFLFYMSRCACPINQARLRGFTDLSAPDRHREFFTGIFQAFREAFLKTAILQNSFLEAYLEPS